MCDCKDNLLLLHKLITGSVLKVKRQDNIANFVLDDSETIVSVITGIKTLISYQDLTFPNHFLHCKSDRF